jgi:hypothetical protein|tara:strand:+ start:292 stop:612 length:321 start_codon:yes stop_codon:yes gene_type:complete
MVIKRGSKSFLNQNVDPSGFDVSKSTVQYLLPVSETHPSNASSKAFADPPPRNEGSRKAPSICGNNGYFRELGRWGPYSALINPVIASPSRLTQILFVGSVIQVRS